MDPELEMAEYQKMDHIFKELIANGEDKMYRSIMRTPGKNWIKLVKMWTNKVTRALEE